MHTDSLKFSIENCGQTAADGDIVTICRIGSRQSPIRW